MNASLFVIIIIVISFSLLNNSFAEFEKEIKYNNSYGIYTIPYSMTNGEITKIEKNYCSLVISLSGQNQDHLTITIPRGLISATAIPSGENRIDVDFVILVNGSETDFEESSNSLQRTIKIPLSLETSEIEIIGAQDPRLSYSIDVCTEIPKESKYLTLFSPKRQIDNGILPTAILCKENLEKIFKPIDKYPMCVKPETKTKLVERGWTT